MSADPLRDDYADQTAQIKQFFEPVMTEPIPERMHLRQPAWIAHAKAAILVGIGIAIGLMVSMVAPLSSDPSLATAQLPLRAARAHVVYASEVRHPVEVDATQQEHLVKWLSKRLGIDLKVPVLAREGFELLGGRLLPGNEGPVAQFMYQDQSGKRLTLYVTRPHKGDALTAFRFAQEGPVSVFYWMDSECGYALSGELERPALAKVATAVYRQLEN
ncbi:MAG TPA: anti-sigma factor [Usitatibacter sp.]|jgi:anti-sigma factor RsiW|nr:anti-sigma factor [Usitatibacter sp.]